MTYPASVLRYFAYGFLLGLCFPMLAILVDLYLHQLPLSFENILELQRTQPLHWILDCVPFLTAIISVQIAWSELKIKNIQNSMEQKLKQRTQTLRDQNRRLQREIEYFLEGQS